MIVSLSTGTFAKFPKQAALKAQKCRPDQSTHILSLGWQHSFRTVCSCCNGKSDAAALRPAFYHGSAKDLTVNSENRILLQIRDRSTLSPHISNDNPTPNTPNQLTYGPIHCFGSPHLSQYCEVVINPVPRHLPHTSPTNLSPFRTFTANSAASIASILPTSTRNGKLANP